MEIASGAVFKSNSAKLGGAIYNKGNLGTLDGVTFEDNTAETNGGAIFNGGTTAANITLDNVQFIGNQAANGSGGAISTSGVVNIANATFENNSASTGGGAINVDGTVKLSGENTFSGNSCLANFGTFLSQAGSTGQDCRWNGSIFCCVYEKAIYLQSVFFIFFFIQNILIEIIIVFKYIQFHFYRIGNTCTLCYKRSFCFYIIINRCF